METQEQTKVSKFLSGLLPEVKVNTNVGINQNQVLETAAIVFIAAVLIMVSYFSIKKLFN